METVKQNRYVIAELIKMVRSKSWMVVVRDTLHDEDLRCSQFEVPHMVGQEIFDIATKSGGCKRDPYKESRLPTKGVIEVYTIDPKCGVSLNRQGDDVS